MRHIKLFVVLAVFPFALAGCGPSNVNADGKVMRGGQPHSPRPEEYLSVNLSSETGGEVYSGKVTADGSFVIESKDNSGVKPGKYKVSVTRYLSPAFSEKGKPGTPATLHVDEPWEVSSANKSLTIDLDKIGYDKLPKAEKKK